jgi:1-deoxy-D-xylulose-5-phosphate reductoisomerase
VHRARRRRARRGGHGPGDSQRANEVAVAAFLDSRIRYTDIAPACTEALARLPATNVQCLDDAMAADAEARAVARSWLKLPKAA